MAARTSGDFLTRVLASPSSRWGPTT
jgi:hypothetical protein